ncbi:MAG: restriction endonuclease subunit S [Limnohabitans sp.]|nr:restriction endonuclease subunit S [Limnohabitans sp.]
MSWKACRLGDVMTLKRGHDLPEHSRQEGDVPVVSSSGITGRHKEAKATAPGVVTGRYGTIGEVYFLQEDFWPLNTALYVIDFKGNDPRFTSYFLRNVLKGYQSEKAAIPGVDRNVLHEIKVQLPSLPEQLRITEILSTYDDLIDNNRRRMALLEDSARQLYREWFVRLRFPGHEHTPIVDGVPHGWQRKTLGESVMLNYGKALKAELRVEGDYPVYGSSGIVGTHEKPLVQGPAIVLGRKGNVGSVYWSSKSFFPIDTVYFVSAESSSLYLYYVLKHMHFISTDVAVPGLNRDFAYSRTMLHPPETLLRSFHETVESIHAQLDKLDETTQKLRQARDLLLPRLMNGELAV